MKLITVASIITLSLITITMTQASVQKNSIGVNTFTPTKINATLHYDKMSTEMIQLEVEKHSEIGNLPFALGQELIKRWSQS